MTPSIEERLVEFYDHVTADVPAEGPGLNTVPLTHVTPASGTERRSARMAVALVAAAAAILIVGLVVVTRSRPNDPVPAAPSVSTLPGVTPSTTVTEILDTVPAIASPSIVQPAVASCATEDLLAAVVLMHPENDIWDLTSVDVTACQNGFAEVVVVMNQNGCPTPGVDCRENPTVWLQDVAGSWAMVDEGSGIGCDPESITPSIEAACRALGDAATANPTSTSDPSVPSEPNALAAIDFNLGQPIQIPSLFGFVFASEIDPDAVTPTIEPVLGAPDRDTGWLPMPFALTCNGADEYRSILWGDLRFVLNATDTNGDGSSDGFWLAAWSVGDVSLSFSPPLDVPIEGASGITDSSGLGIGSPKSAIMDHDFVQFSDQGDQVFALAAPGPVRFALVDDRVTAMSMEANDC